MNLQMKSLEALIQEILKANDVDNIFQSRNLEKRYKRVCTSPVVREGALSCWSSAFSGTNILSYRPDISVQNLVKIFSSHYFDIGVTWV